MITGVELLPFMCNKPWPLRFLTQQQYKVLIRLTGLVLLLVGILYAVQIMQFEARKRLIHSGYDSADIPARVDIAETDIDWLPTTLSNLSIDERSSDNNDYSTEGNWSSYRGDVNSAVIFTKRNYNYTPLNGISLAENDNVATKSDKACDNCGMETGFNVSSGLSEDGNYSSQLRWLNDLGTNASAAISVEGHSNNTEGSSLPESNIWSLMTAKNYGNYSREIDMFPSPDSKVLAATSVKNSNYSTFETNQFTSVDGNIFAAVTPKNNSDLTQTNRSRPPLNNISGTTNTKDNFKVIEKISRFIRGSSISEYTTVNDNNYTSGTLVSLASFNDTSNEKSVYSITPLPSQVTSKNLPGNVNNNYASKKNLFTISLLLFYLNHS